LDKNQTKELAFSFMLMIIGIIFWVIKIRYFTFFWLPEFHFLNVFGLEIIGTILILSGMTIVYRVYPFPYSFIGLILIVIILVSNVLDFILFRYKLFREIQQFSPVLVSLMLILISKLMESGLKYFENRELSKEWKYLAIIILYGFTIPYYCYMSMNLCGFITYEGFKITIKILLIFLPILIALLSISIYYLRVIIQTFRFLLKIHKDSLPKPKDNG
jgi:hypothetical protein